MSSKDRLVRQVSNTARRISAGFFVLLSALNAGCQEETPPAASVRLPQTDPAPAITQHVTSARLPKDQPRSLPTVDEARVGKGANGWFVDVTKQSGMAFSYSDGSDAGFFQLLESVGGGVLCADYDRDGQQDVFLPGGGVLSGADAIVIGGKAGGLFRNQPLGQFTDQSANSGVNTASLYSHGGCTADLDADGFDDIIICGYGGIQIWRNAGDGTFAEQSASLGIHSERWNISAAVADYDLDGLPDLYLLTYADWFPDIHRRCQNDKHFRDICGPTMFGGVQDVLWHNSGTGFEDVTEPMGLVPANRGLGILATDLNGDARPDFAVVNDVEENQLYLNQGDEKFSEDALVWGMAYSDTGEREGSMGVSASDFNRDGLLDVWYTNYAQQDNSLMRNSSNSGFVHTASVTGLKGVSRPWVGFGTAFADFDCDGWDDLIVINGHVAYERLDSPYYQPPQIFKNDQGQRFRDVSPDGGRYFNQTRSGRGAAVVDLDNDGAPDLVVSHQNDPVTVLMNTADCDYWLSVELIGRSSDRNAVGASVTLALPDGDRRKWVISGGSYLSSSDKRLLFSLDSSQSIEVLVTWPGGQQEVFRDVAIATHHKLIQGRGHNVGS